MFPLTGNGQLDKDLAEEHQRELLEEAEADAIAKGEAHEGDFEPLTDESDDMIVEPKRNKHVKHDDR
jgi:hypothetical protein